MSENCVLVFWAFLFHTGLFAPGQRAFGSTAAEIGPSAHMATLQAHCGSVTMCIADTPKIGLLRKNTSGFQIPFRLPMKDRLISYISIYIYVNTVVGEETHSYVLSTLTKTTATTTKTDSRLNYN